MYLKFVMVLELIFGSQVLATRCKNTLICFIIYMPDLDMAVGVSIR